MKKPTDICRRAEALINRCLDHEATAEEAEELQRHLQVCADCATVFQFTCALEGAAAELPVPASETGKARAIARAERILAEPCQRAEALMGPCLDGQATREEAEELRSHLLDCPVCAAQFHLAKTIDGALPEIPVPASDQA